MSKSQLFISLLLQPSNANADNIDKESLEVVEFHDHRRVALIVKVIGLMCDGQHREMQNYLREQKESLGSFNIVEEITTFVYEYSKRRVITSDVLPLITEAFQTLIELCSGNAENSEVIFQKQILSTINFILQLDITEIKPPDDKPVTTDMKKEYIKVRINALKLKAAVVELLEAMLERVTSDTEKLTRQIAEGLDNRALQYSMIDFLVLKDDKDLKDKEADDNAQRALFKTYSVINHLISSEGSEKSKFSKFP